MKIIPVDKKTIINLSTVLYLQIQSIVITENFSQKL